MWHWHPGKHFQRHTHWGGDETLVLEGEFADEHGRFPEGTRLRSAHMSQHSPLFRERERDLGSRRRPLIHFGHAASGGRWTP